MKNDQKGITLVALIITIIVMLILVAVTISIALQGGLFDKARTASKETRIAQVNEAIALAKADIVSDYYDPTNRTVRANHVVTYLGTAPDVGDVATVVNGYLDEKVISVEGASKTTDADGNTVYSFTIVDEDEDHNPINTDISDRELNTIVLDLWQTN